LRKSQNLKVSILTIFENVRFSNLQSSINIRGRNVDVFHFLSGSQFVRLLIYFGPQFGRLSGRNLDGGFQFFGHNLDAARGTPDMFFRIFHPHRFPETRLDMKVKRDLGIQK